MKKLISVLFFAALFLMSSSNNVAASSDIIGPNTVHKESNQIFTIIDLLSLYDNDVFVEDDGYTGNGNVPGEYTVVLSKGLSTKEVRIIVVENWGNLINSNDVLFVTDFKNIHVSSDRELSLYEIIYYIYNRTNYIDIGNFRYEELVNDYHRSFSDGHIPEGSYEHTFRITYYSGEQATFSTTINVIELQELPGIVLEPPPSTIDKIMSTLPWFLGVLIIGYFVINRKKKRGFY